MLNEAKVALRIAHDKLDEAIRMEIEAAQAEMIRVGVAESAVRNDEDPLIRRAVITYCKYEHESDIKKKDAYERSFKIQLDNLRRSRGYRSGVNA